MTAMGCRVAISALSAGIQTPLLTAATGVGVGKGVGSGVGDGVGTAVGSGVGTAVALAVGRGVLALAVGSSVDGVHVAAMTTTSVTARTARAARRAVRTAGSAGTTAGRSVMARGMVAAERRIGFVGRRVPAALPYAQARRPLVRHSTRGAVR
jgi:hypothetical protein